MFLSTSINFEQPSHTFIHWIILNYSSCALFPSRIDVEISEPFHIIVVSFENSHRWCNQVFSTSSPSSSSRSFFNLPRLTAHVIFYLQLFFARSYTPPFSVQTSFATWSGGALVVWTGRRRSPSATTTLLHFQLARSLSFFFSLSLSYSSRIQVIRHLDCYFIFLKLSPNSYWFIHIDFTDHPLVFVRQTRFCQPTLSIVKMASKWKMNYTNKTKFNFY